MSDIIIELVGEEAAVTDVERELSSFFDSGAVKIKRTVVSGGDIPVRDSMESGIWNCSVFLPGGYDVYEKDGFGGSASFVLLDEFTNEQVIEYKQAGVTGCLPYEADGVIDVLATDIQHSYQEQIEEELFDNISGLFNGSPLKLTLVDKDGVVKYTNMESVSMREDGVGVEIGDPYYELWGNIDENDKTAIRNGVESVLSRNVNKFMYDYQVIDGDGKGWAMLYVTWVEYGDETFAVVTQFDVTQTSERLAVLNRIVRHDVSNKMNIVNGYLQSIQDADGETKEQVRMAIEKITNATEAMLELCSKLREVDTRLQESGKHVVSVGERVDEAVRRVRGKDQTVDVDVDVDEELYVYADTTLSEGIYELLENTVDHVESPSVSVEAFSEVVGSNEQVVIRVMDDGAGLTERQSDLLNGTLRVTQVDHGTGIGLWFVRWLIERFDGEVVFGESDAGGVEVVIRLPKASVEDVET